MKERKNDKVSAFYYFDAYAVITLFRKILEECKNERMNERHTLGLFDIRLEHIDG